MRVRVVQLSHERNISRTGGMDMAQITSGLIVGNRVAIHPATDAWMMGEKYGHVTKIGRRDIHVTGERSGRNFRFRSENVRYTA